jgi:hypothetical protein
LDLGRVSAFLPGPAFTGDPQFEIQKSKTPLGRFGDAFGTVIQRKNLGK